MVTGVIGLDRAGVDALTARRQGRYRRAEDTRQRVPDASPATSIQQSQGRRTYLDYLLYT